MSKEVVRYKGRRLQSESHPYHSCPLCGRPCGYAPPEARIYHIECSMRATAHLRKS